MLHDVVAGGEDGDDGGDDGQPGATVATITWGGGRLGAPQNLGLLRRLWGAEDKCLECVLGTSDVPRRGGCGGSFHPDAQTVTGEV